MANARLPLSQVGLPEHIVGRFNHVANGDRDSAHIPVGGDLDVDRAPKCVGRTGEQAAEREAASYLGGAPPLGVMPQLVRMRPDTDGQALPVELRRHLDHHGLPGRCVEARAVSTGNAGVDRESSRHSRSVCWDHPGEVARGRMGCDILGGQLLPLRNLQREQESGERLLCGERPLFER
jgi:hypothetical protein